MSSKGAAALAVSDRYGKAVWSPRREAELGPCSCRLARLRDGPGGSLDFALFGFSLPSLWETRPQGRKDLEKEHAKTRQQFQETAPEPRGAGSGGWWGKGRWKGLRLGQGLRALLPAPSLLWVPAGGQQQSPHFQAHSPPSSLHRLQNQRRWT